MTTKLSYLFYVLTLSALLYIPEGSSQTITPTPVVTPTIFATPTPQATKTPRKQPLTPNTPNSGPSRGRDNRPSGTETNPTSPQK